MTVKKIVKDTIGKGNFFFRCSTSHLRVLPDFLIVGAQKCGTSSLYRNLVKHPSVIPAFVKEIYFFNTKYFQKGVKWYRAYFPLLPYKYYVTRICKRDFLTGEATPGYIFHPHAPRRIFELLPDVKIIVLLRNPVDRAYSHYYHEVRKKRESLSFEDAIKMEEERLRGEFDKIINDENYYSFNYLHYSYLSRGIYVEQLQRLHQYFKKEHILIIKSEDFFKDSQATIEKVLQFLGLPGWQPTDFKKVNVGSYQKMDPAVRSRLLDYFEPHNHRLYEYLGINFGWEK
ncbi:MAG TPA: sulfotransferase family protein [Candidatus Wunengus sp. YC60]|uniref:sulfotransferase family protein n=1 Tax=Candidatus Wunengus sp. YC60 TaxID=3367697 RepID=UPI004024C37A